MTHGHLPSLCEELAAVLQRHGFQRIDSNAIRSLVESHKDDFIRDLLGERDRLHDELSRLDDLPVIVATLHTAIHRPTPEESHELRYGDDVRVFPRQEVS